MLHRYFILLVFFFLSCSIFGQEVVYPGDANNNGHVDHYDILPIGFAYGSVGPTRIDHGPHLPQDILEYWDDDFPSGLNYTHADANGDGQVDFFDYFLMTTNNGFSFTEVGTLVFSDQLPGAQASVVIDQDELYTTNDASGQTLSLSVDIETLTADQMVNGVAFNIAYDPAYFDVIDFEFSTEWINANNSALRIINTAPGLIHLGISRFGNDPVSGGGNIGVLNLTIIEDLVGLIPPAQGSTVDLVRVGDIQIYDDDFHLIPTAAQGVSLINEAISSVAAPGTPPANALSALVFPNPVGDQFQLNSERAFNQVELCGVDGVWRTLYRGPSLQQLRQNTNELPPGFYTIRCSGPDGQSIIALSKQ